MKTPPHSLPTRAALVLALAVLYPVTAGAQGLPTGFYVENAAPDATFDTPVALAFAADGRMFVAEKGGVVWIVEDGVKLPQPFIDLSWDVLNHHDRGLLGLTLDPDFLNNGYAYFLYTFDWNQAGDTQRTDVPGRLVRYQASVADPNVADVSTRTVLLGSSFSNAIPACYFSHAPGCLRFGTDGTLLISAGDGASYNQVDPGGLYSNCFGMGKLDASQDIGAFRAQWLGSYAGKILRIDPSTGQGLPSNPFYTGDPDDVESKVWAYGVRNPYRFGVRNNGSSDPADGNPGTLYIGDVGWNVYEELNVAHGGENFGWPCYEGPNPHGGYQSAAPAHHGCATIGTPANPSPHTPPLTWWHHGNAALSFPTGFTGATATGGTFYEGSKYPPEYQGLYFYGDYTGQWIKALTVNASDQFVAQSDFATSLGGIVDLVYDPFDQYLYYINIFEGAVMCIRHVDGDANQAPVTSAVVEPRWGYAPLLVQFDASATFDPNDDPMTFEWDFGDGNTSPLATTSHLYTVNGNYVAQLTVRDDFGAESIRQIPIAVGNTPPDGVIVWPHNGGAFSVGDKVFLIGSATDAETQAGSLLLHWEVTQTHNVHDHPNFFTGDGPVLSFDIVEHGLPHEVNFLRVELRVSDAGGLADTTTHYIVLNRSGETDITGDGTPIAFVTAPTGSGNPDISVVHDGVLPVAGTTDPLLQYDTDTGGGPRTSDWIGYQFADVRYFSRLLFQEGIQSPAGGWFESLDVEVLDNGVWTPVVHRQVVPPYRGNDGMDFDMYTVTFQAVAGTAIRIVGAPGGTGDYISAGEIRVYEIPRAEFSADVRIGANPLPVTFTDLSSVPGATSWLWRFGDGATSTDPSPTHLYSVPGPHTVSLTVTGPDGVHFEEKQRYILVGTPGLSGEYFDNIDLTAPVLSRVDPAVDFNWDTGSPHASVGPDAFSARWTGWVHARYTETMTLHTFTDDGVRLWVDGQILIDKWANQPPTEWTASIPMVADRLYEIRMEYFDNDSGATARLQWSSASQALETIPQARLWARECGQGTGDMDGNGTLTPGDALCVFNTFLNNQVVPVSCNTPAHECEDAAADTDCSGTVTPGDALAVYEHYLAGQPLEVCLGQTGFQIAAADGQAGAPRIAVERYQSGDAVEVTLVVRDPRAMRAIGFCVEHPAGFEFDTLVPAPGTRDWLMADAWSHGAGSIFVGGFDTRGTDASGAVEFVRVRLRRTAPDADAAAIRLVNFVDDLAGATTTASDGAPGVPGAFGLHQNHPNPFNPQTSIRFDVPAGSERVAVQLSVYDVRGKLVRMLTDDTRGPGVHMVTWDGRDQRGNPVTSGVYFYRLNAGDFRESRRMVLLK